MLPGSPGFLYFGWLSGTTLKSDFSLLIFVDCALRRPRALSGHFPGPPAGDWIGTTLHIYVGPGACTAPSMHICVIPGACIAPSMHIYEIPGACTAPSMHIYVGPGARLALSMHFYADTGACTAPSMHFYADTAACTAIGAKLQQGGPRCLLQLCPNYALTRDCLLDASGPPWISLFRMAVWSYS